MTARAAGRRRGPSPRRRAAGRAAAVRPRRTRVSRGSAGAHPRSGGPAALHRAAAPRGSSAAGRTRPAAGARSVAGHSAFSTLGPRHRSNACSSATDSQSVKKVFARASVKTYRVRWGPSFSSSPVPTATASWAPVHARRSPSRLVTTAMPGSSRRRVSGTDGRISRIAPVRGRGGRCTRRRWPSRGSAGARAPPCSGRARHRGRAARRPTGCGPGPARFVRDGLSFPLYCSAWQDCRPLDSHRLRSTPRRCWSSCPGGRGRCARPARRCLIRREGGGRAAPVRREDGGRAALVRRETAAGLLPDRGRTGAVPCPA